MVALLLALKKCNDNTLDMAGIQHINIYTDSKALTHLIETRYPRDHIELLGAIKTEAANLAAAKIQILVQWIPSHVDLSGNEAADRAAKTASNLPNTSDFGRPKTHFRGQINKLCRAEFQEWALGKLRGSKNRLAEFYQLVNPELKPQKHSHSIPRVLEQLVLFLRINSLSICPMIHTNYCAACDMVPFSTTHYLLECPSTTEVVKKLTKPMLPANPSRRRLMEEAARSTQKLSKHPRLLHEIASTCPPIVVCKCESCPFFDIEYNAYPSSWKFSDISHFAGSQ